MPSADNEYLMRIWEMMSGEDGGSGIKADVSVTVPPVTVDTTALQAEIGGTTDAAVVGDNVGSLAAKARGLNKTVDDVHDVTNHALQVNVVAGAGGGGAMTVADGADVALGSTTDSGVTTDANGTVIGFLRGIIKLIIAKLAVKAASGDFADGSVATLGAKADAKDDHTDATAITLMQVLKAISYYLQNPASQAVTMASILVPDTNKDLDAVACGAGATVWTPAGGAKVRLMGGCISVSAACSVVFTEQTAGTVIFRTPKLLVDTPYNFDLGNSKLTGTADHTLIATSSSAANVTGTLYGKES